MQTTTQPRDLLSLLRLVESTPEGDAEWARHCATQQAVLLRLQLPGGGAADLNALSTAIGIPIDVLPDMPIPGTAFPAHGKWHIHVSSELDKVERLRTALHELKHVIDHPARDKDKEPGGLSNDNYESLADLFADQVLSETGP